jgi:hypothetical protein
MARNQANNVGGSCRELQSGGTGQIRTNRKVLVEVCVIVDERRKLSLFTCNKTMAQALTKLHSIVGHGFGFTAKRTVI